MTQQVHGYAEGYYGRLFTWGERRRIIDALSSNGQNTYYYAPKEDALHRWLWRTEYSHLWLNKFTLFCSYARGQGVSVIAGVAPGLDFNFKDLPNGTDYEALLKKCHSLMEAGADYLSLLLDDIDEDFHNRCGHFSSEGEAHAALANTLACELGISIWVTPRVYADELIISDAAYLPDFLSTLNESHVVLYCGSDVVARDASVCSLRSLSEYRSQRLVLWDNLYANDYCPRRLFIGPWQGRSAAHDVLLNPTGMINTDILLLDVMASQSGLADSSAAALEAWRTVLIKHGVPDVFFELAPYFYHPVFNRYEQADLPAACSAVMAAIEHCLWRWKTPLAREWYSYIFGLKHDLLLEQNQLPPDRIRKTQTPALSQTLLRRI